MPALKILLFGKTGQLGSQLNKKLAHYSLDAFDYPEVDFNDPGQLHEIVISLKPALIVNAAAYTAVDQAEDHTEMAYTINAYAVEAIAQAAKKLNTPLIHYSTDYVFDGKKNRLYTEIDHPNPINVYGKSKLLGEEKIIQSGANHLIFRLSWVYSSSHPCFLRSVLDWSRKHETLRIVEDQISNPTWARMVADKTAQIIERSVGYWPGYFSQLKGIYHLVGNGAVSRFDWAKAILELDPNKTEQKTTELLKAKSADFKTPAQRPAFSGLDCAKFEKTFNIDLPDWKISLMEAMREI